MAATMAGALALTLAACGGDSGAEEDPEQAVQDAAAAMSDWEGFEVIMAAEADDEARGYLARQEEMSEDVLDLLLGAQVTMRGTQPEEGSGDFELLVEAGGEEVLGVRQPVEDDLFVRLDLGAVESLAGDVEGGEEFSSSLSELDAMGGMLGLGEVLTAAREGEWIRVTGVEDLADSFGGMAGEDAEGEELDEEDAEALAEELSEQFTEFLEGDGVTVEHLGQEDAGDHVRVTAQGEAIRELMTELEDEVSQLDGLAGAGAMGDMGSQDLQADLEEIPEDLEVSIDAWLQDGQISRVGLDVFELARQSGEGGDVEGSLRMLFDLADFSDEVAAPETDVTFDPAETFGGLLGGMGGMGEMGGAGEADASGDAGGTGSSGEAGEAPPSDALGSDGCLPEEQLDAMMEQMPESEREAFEQQVESGAVPVC